MNIRMASPGDPVSQKALEGFLRSAPIFGDIEFVPKKGSSIEVKQAREAGSKTTITRALNTDNSPSAPTPTYEYPVKKIVSFDATVDVVLEDRNEDPEAELAHQTYLEAYEAGFAAQELAFNGDSAAIATNPDGIDTLVTAGNTFSDGVALPIGGDSVHDQMQVAAERFIRHLKRVKMHSAPSYIYMPDQLLARWITIGKELGYYRTAKDALGQEIDTFMGVPIKSAGLKKDGSEILAPVNGKYSIYFVRFGEGVDLFAITSVGMRGRYAGQIGNQILNNVNMDFNLHLQNDRAIVKSTGWSLAAV